MLISAHSYHMQSLYGTSCPAYYLIQTPYNLLSILVISCFIGYITLCNNVILSIDIVIVVNCTL